MQQVCPAHQLRPALQAACETHWSKVTSACHDSASVQLLRRWPQLLQQDLEQSTRSAVALLVSYGLRDEQLVHVLTSAPRVLAESLPSLQARISFAQEHLGASLQVSPSVLMLPALECAN